VTKEDATVSKAAVADTGLAVFSDSKLEVSNLAVLCVVYAVNSSSVVCGSLKMIN
jgi:hypothetical protein